MHIKIKELLLQVVPMEGDDGDLSPSLHTPSQIQKFAESIVQECVQYLNTEGDRLHEMNRHENEDLQAEKCYENAKAIQQLFGMEAE